MKTFFSLTTVGLLTLSSANATLLDRVKSWFNYAEHTEKNETPKANDASTTPENISKTVGQHQLFSFAPVAKKVTPSIVNIYSQRVVKQNPMESFFFGRGFFDLIDPRFSMPREAIQQSLGSGVILDESGVIITNSHVVKDASEIKVVLADGREFEATLAVKDDKLDLALLNIKPEKDEKLPAIKVGNPNKLEVGDWVVAVGNPFGLEHTVTTGIVSALGRWGFIQSDVAINPGNSGGALVNTAGELVGINNFIISKTGTSNGLGFAIPIDMARPALEHMAKGDKSKSPNVERGWAGLTVQSVSQKIAKSLGLAVPRGVIINRIHAKSPARDGGLMEGDVILALNHRPIHDERSFNYRMWGFPQNEKVTFTVMRQGKKMDIAFNLKHPVYTPAPNRKLLRGNHILSGVTVANLSPGLEAELGLDINQEGVVIESVKETSPIFIAFKPGDVILEVGGERIENVEGLIKALQSNGINRIKLLRDNQVINIAS